MSLKEKGITLENCKNCDNFVDKEKSCFSFEMNNAASNEDTLINDHLKGTFYH